MGIEEWVVVGLSALFFGWFLVGTLMNNRKMEAAIRQLQTWVKPFGTLSAARRFDPSSLGFSLLDVPPESPYSQMEVILSLSRRENLPLWLFQTFRKRQDLMILKATFRHAPHNELHALSIQDSHVLDSLNATWKKTLVLSTESGKLPFYHRGQISQEVLSSASEFLNHNENWLTRLSIQPKKPQLNLQGRLDAFDPSKMSAVLAKIVELGRD